MSRTETRQEERQSLLAGGAANEGSSSDARQGQERGDYGAVSRNSPRLCLVFSDSFLGGKRSAWLAKLKAFGFEVEQTSPRFIAVAAPDQMLQAVAIQRGSHGYHTMPATRERVLHFLLSEFDPTLAAFLEIPGPYREEWKRLPPLSQELQEAGLEGWFWLHDKDSAAVIAPKYAWSGCFGLSRQPLAAIREYFGTEIAWNFLYMNFLARWMLVPAAGGAAYTYWVGFTFIRTGSFDNQFLPIFSGGMMVWGLIMLFFWFRLKARYEEKWLEDVAISGREDLNTDSELESRVDPQTGETELFYPDWKRRLRQILSAMLLILPMVGAVGAGLGALDFRARIMNMEPPLYGGILSGVFTAVVLFLVVRLVCFHWSRVMTLWENWPTRSGYNSALAVKFFTFDTIAHLFPILFMALLNWPIMSRFAPSNEPSIVDALTIQASSVFLTWYLCYAGMWFVTQYRWQSRAQEIAERTGSEDGRPDFNHEEQAARPVYRNTQDSRAWVNLQTLYALVLAPVCPLAPVLFYLWLMNRLHWEKIAMIYLYRRPHPQAAPGGGFWAETFQILTVVSLATQIPLILFCTNGLDFWFPSLTLEERWGMFATLEILVAGDTQTLCNQSYTPVPSQKKTWTLEPELKELSDGTVSICLPLHHHVKLSITKHET